MSDKMRSEFEAWAHSENWCLAKDSNGIYIKVYVAFAYQAWQASRAALVVELPKGSGGECGWLVSLTDVEDALDAAGVKRK